jgi:hypothetical protein
MGEPLDKQVDRKVHEGTDILIIHNAGVLIAIVMDTDSDIYVHRQRQYVCILWLDRWIDI